MSDRVNKALTEAFLLKEPRIYNTTSKHNGVPLTTLYHRYYKRRSKEVKA